MGARGRTRRAARGLRVRRHGGRFDTLYAYDRKIHFVQASGTKYLSESLKVHVIPGRYIWRADCEVCEQQQHSATRRDAQLWQEVRAQCSAEG